MKKLIINNCENNFKTKILLKSNYLDTFIKNIIKRNQKNYFIIDSKLKKFFEKKLKHNINNHIIYIKGGEKIKSFKNYIKISEKLISLNIDRKSTLIAIGGGTIGDLSGFIASTIMRGINFILIPSSLLSQVDSSIGGKNGINSSNGKNLIGTFYQPNQVIIDPKLLYTLPTKEIRCGYAEIVKHSLIYDKKFFYWLDNNWNEIFKLNLKKLEEAIYKSILIKLNYVKKDFKENLINNRSRAILNFGHSFGHALETFYKYKINHGEAISIGMIIESKISNILGFLSDDHLEKIINHFSKCGLKINDKNIKNKLIFNNLIKDKKNSNNKINIILLKRIGSSFYKRNLSLKSIRNIVSKF